MNEKMIKSSGATAPPASPVIPSLIKEMFEQLGVLQAKLNILDNLTQTISGPADNPEAGLIEKNPELFGFITTDLETLRVLLMRRIHYVDGITERLKQFI